VTFVSPDEPTPRLPGKSAGHSITRWYLPARLVAPAVACVVLILLMAAVWCLRIVPDAKEFRIIGNSDLYLYFCPMLEVAFSELRAGRLFLWNPYQLAGLPGLATLQVGALYPPHLLYLLLSTALALGVMTFAHLVGVAVSTTVAGRTLGLSWAAAVVAGVCFALSGCVMGRIIAPPDLEPLVWLPLGVAAIERVISSGDRRWLPVCTASVALPILAGGYQMSVYILYTYLIYGVLSGASLWWHERSLQRLVARGCWLAVAAIAGLALAAPQVLPTLELSEQSVRSPSGLSLPQILLWGQTSTVASVVRNALASPTEFVPGYVGAIPLALAAGALCARRDRGVVFSLTLVSWGVLGTLAPLWFVRSQALLPALGWFRIPSRVFVLASFGIALLAGFGFDALWRRASCSTLLSVLLTAGASLVFAVVRYPASTWWLAVALVPIAAIAGLARHRMVSGVAAGGIGLLLCIDLVGVPRNKVALPYLDGSWQHTRRHSAMLQPLGRLAGTFRTLVVGPSFEWPIKPALVVRSGFEWPIKAAMLDKIYSPADYEPLAMRQVADFFEYAASGQTYPNDRLLPFTGRIPDEVLRKSTPRSRRFLRLLSVRFFVLHRFDLLDPGMRQFADKLQAVSVSQREEDPEARDLLVLEDEAALPRAYGVYAAECLPTLEEQLARLADPGFDPRAKVILDGECPRADGRSDRPGAVSITSYTPTVVELVADMAGPGFVVLTDSDYPGWQAFVNGRREPILRANTLVRAVRVPAGRSRIEFRYVPWSFYLGTTMAAVPIALGLLLLIRRFVLPSRLTPHS
jgi:hypothetical protein